MALINCPECGREISDKAISCPGCGYPISSFINEAKTSSNVDELNQPEELNICKSCGFENEVGKIYCEDCGMRLIPYAKPKDSLMLRNEKTASPDFDGIFRYTLFGKKQEVYCPRCKSSDCSHYQEQRTIQGKTKTRYTANLNPLHPFTLANKKEKVVRNDVNYTVTKFVCNKCGKIFN